MHNVSVEFAFLDKGLDGRGKEGMDPRGRKSKQAAVLRDRAEVFYHDYGKPHPDLFLRYFPHYTLKLLCRQVL